MPECALLSVHVTFWQIYRRFGIRPGDFFTIEENGFVRCGRAFAEDPAYTYVLPLPVMDVPRLKA